jgi:hypothetical protein
MRRNVDGMNPTGQVARDAKDGLRDGKVEEKWEMNK